MQGNGGTAGFIRNAAELALGEVTDAGGGQAGIRQHQEVFELRADMRVVAAQFQPVGRLEPALDFHTIDQRLGGVARYRLAAQSRRSLQSALDVVIIIAIIIDVEASFHTIVKAPVALEADFIVGRGFRGERLENGRGHRGRLVVATRAIAGAGGDIEQRVAGGVPVQAGGVGQLLEIDGTRIVGIRRQAGAVGEKGAERVLERTMGDNTISLDDAASPRPVVVDQAHTLSIGFTLIPGLAQAAGERHGRGHVVGGLPEDRGAEVGGRVLRRAKAAGGGDRVQAGGDAIAAFAEVIATDDVFQLVIQRLAQQIQFLADLVLLGVVHPLNGNRQHAIDARLRAADHIGGRVGHDGARVAGGYRRGARVQQHASHAAHVGAGVAAQEAIADDVAQGEAVTDVELGLVGGREVGDLGVVAIGQLVLADATGFIGAIGERLRVDRGAQHGVAVVVRATREQTEQTAESAHTQARPGKRPEELLGLGGKAADFVFGGARKSEPVFNRGAGRGVMRRNTPAFAVNVVVIAAVGHVMHITVAAIELAGGTNLEIAGNGHVDRAFHLAGRVVATGGGDIAAKIALGHLRGEQDGARGLVLAEQRALRALQHLNVGHVEQAGVQALLARHGDFVDIDADRLVGLDEFQLLALTANQEVRHRVAIARRALLQRGDGMNEVGRIGDALGLHQLRRQHGDRRRNVNQLFRFAAGGNQNVARALPGGSLRRCVAVGQSWRCGDSHERRAQHQCGNYTIHYAHSPFIILTFLNKIKKFRPSPGLLMPLCTSLLRVEMTSAAQN